MKYVVKLRSSTMAYETLTRKIIKKHPCFIQILQLSLDFITEIKTITTNVELAETL
jgi:hypothetical protein